MIPTLQPPPFTQHAHTLASALGVDIERGLSSNQARQRRNEFGPNRLEEVPPTPWWQRLFAQFNELVVWILIAAAIIAGFLGDWTDTVAITAIVLLNGLIGYFQEARAARALEALRKLSNPTAKVRRDGRVTELAIAELVPGDIIEIEAGDNIPADGRLIFNYSFSVQEATLTGESAPVVKNASAMLPADLSIADRVNMVYMGTTVSTGKGVVLVTATGMQTELGHIAGLLQREEPEPTPLQRRLDELGKVLIIVCLALVAIIYVAQVLRGESWIDTLLLSVSLAVAAVPEGLPAVVTVTLALGLHRMVRRQALVRKLPSVETLGSVTVICSDKTGTLTRNEMTVREVVVGDEAFDVSRSLPSDRDTGAVPRQCPGHSEVTGTRDTPNSDLEFALTIAATCNTARIEPGEHGKQKVIGDPTEVALLFAAKKAGVTAESAGTVTHEVPFDSERKAMSVVVTGADGSHTLMTKGAPEVVLSRCTTERRKGKKEPLTEPRRTQIAAKNGEMADQAQRVLALAYREDAPPQANVSDERDLTFSGLVGMMDPPREEAKAAVAECRAAGLRPIMITGDHPATAAAIARELGILTVESLGLRVEGQSAPDSSSQSLNPQPSTLNHSVVTGRDLDAWTDAELQSRVNDIAVYARVSPEHKLRIVKAWKQRGEIVAMTGDGVNDAPAVRAADIGVAMGITGSDVTKEASDMVLMDDNFVTIVNAIEEGRGIFDNIQKFVHYLLACNTGEVLFMFIATLLGWPAPLKAIQVLWINLITDGIPALALALEPLESDVMKRPPRPPKAPVISARDGRRIGIHGTLIALATLIAFGVIYDPEVPDSLTEARSAAFCVLAFSQLFYALACRSPHRVMPEIGWFTNPVLFLAIVISGLLQSAVVLWPPLQPWFATTDLPLSACGWVFVLSLLPVSLVEVAKLLRHWRTN